jgi:Uma2 family endonuclease
MTISTAIDTEPLLLDVRDTELHVTSEQFDRLCINNPDLRLELSNNGQLIVMTPAFGESGKQNGDLFGQVWYWNRQNKLGEVFDSSTGYNFTEIGGGNHLPMYLGSKNLA